MCIRDRHNNMAQFEPALIMRWIFKTAVSVWLISNTFDVVMAVFDVTQKVVSDSDVYKRQVAIPST